MNSLILTVTSRLIVPLMLLFSLFLLVRGHNLPGGGFVGGLTAGIALILHALAHSVDHTMRVFRINTIRLISSGLLLALGSGLWGIISGGAFLQGKWLPWDIPVIPKLGTPFLFDIGVYVVVLGITLLITFASLKNV